jgi:predicted RNA-binding Zn ribbon-like protein
MGSGELKPQPGGGYRLDFAAAPPEAAITGPLALSALDFLATADFSRVKQCPGHGPGNDCQWLFLDVSKNNSRRWCDMATCGNRSKSKRHRSRREAVGQHGH